MYTFPVFSVCGTDESLKSMQKNGLPFQIHSWTRTSHSLLRDGIIRDSSEGKCRVWTAGTELRSVVMSELLYVRES